MAGVVLIEQLLTNGLSPLYVEERPDDLWRAVRQAARQLRRFDPIFPVADLARAVAHYSALGFKTFADEDGEDYGFANLEGVSLHLARDPDHDPTRNAVSAYLNVRDADALYEQWSRPGVGGSIQPVDPTPYGMREGSHIDPDGNLIRFGSPIEE
ncbi:MAG: VOC family protein [Solirubrobacteraceae bacterium]